MTLRVDLHLHTTASDGRCTPRELVDRVAAAGLGVMAVTDHDTTAGIAEAAACAQSAGIECVAGIELTAVHAGIDVHMLGYWVDPAEPRFVEFLRTQRVTRLQRVEAIGVRLAELGLRIDVTPILDDARANAGRSVGRPQVARAMITAGYVGTVTEAFDRWLGRGCPAFVERVGASPHAVVEVVHAAHGLVSMAHPGRTALDELIAPLADAGLDAIEVYHSDHGQAEIARYLAAAQAHHLLVSGGSDFHGDPSRVPEPGATTLPCDDWDRLRAARARHV